VLHDHRGIQKGRQRWSGKHTEDKEDGDAAYILEQRSFILPSNGCTQHQVMPRLYSLQTTKRNRDRNTGMKLNKE
jgi:hypothetical protein